MNEIKIAPVGAGAKSNMQLNYSTEKLINQKVLGKSIASELAVFEAVGLHLLNFYDENDVLDEQAIKYIHGQGEGMLKVVDNIKVLIAKLIRAEADNNAHV
ncbi:MAG: hypothetical protein E6672_05805 [Negativicoccus succinicivorans]|nr:hypothetical protein [Negativicoccus succinicivorans]